MNKVDEAMISGASEKENKSERIEMLEKENESLRWSLNKVKEILAEE